MKLSNKPQNNYPERKETTYKTVYIDWKVYEPDENAVLSYGKNRGKTLGWVMDNDDSYYLWMISNGIIGSWGLVKQRYPDSPKSLVGFISSGGEKWVDIRECPGTGISSQYL